MIPRTDSRWQTTDWQNAMKNSIRSLGELCDALDLEMKALNISEQASKDFPLKVPPHYLSNIEPGKVDDPLLMQILPIHEETLSIDGFIADPLDEEAFNPVPGLIHKYQGRVLLISNPSCAINCRYCFRRHFPYQENTPSTAQWADALAYIAGNHSIHEVILSGGDPLSSSDKMLKQLIEQIAQVEHVRTLRIHTRLPVVMPERVTNELIEVITHSRLKAVMVLHINHANELSAAVIDALACLQAHRIRLLNQSVLLKGINDTFEAQYQLLMKLHSIDIQAYYLHVLDHVKGTQHFMVEDSQAKQLFSRLLTALPGYMLPKLVRELPHQAHKTPLI